MLASKPFPCTAEPGVNLVQDQQRAMFRCKLPQQFKEAGLWHIYPASHLDGFDQDRANLFAPEQLFKLTLKFLSPGALSRQLWERQEIAKLSELLPKGVAEVRSMRRVERPITKAMIRRVECDDPGAASREPRRFERSFN